MSSWIQSLLGGGKSEPAPAATDVTLVVPAMN